MHTLEAGAKSMKIDPKEIIKVFEEAECPHCRDTGFCPSSVKLKNMKAGEEPRIVFTFKRCKEGCEENIARLKEIFFL